MSASLGWMLAALVAEWGIDEIQRWMDLQTGHRHTPTDHPQPLDIPEPNRPDASSSFVTGECRDPIEEAEFQELLEAEKVAAELTKNPLLDKV